MKDKLISAVEAMESLRMKFTSGNDVSVDRAVITREEYEAIIDALAKEKK